jgi:EAL domain-containing protein (putative c-di-GMP-specific phosphodiesterase class I)
VYPKIAIDVVGMGIACNQKIIEFQPDFVKLDKYFGIGLSQSKLKQMTVQSYQFLCKGISKIVLEGIETLQDLQVAKELVVHIGQGFYLGKPGFIKSSNFIEQRN